MASDIVQVDKTEALECIYAIEAIAQLMQRAHENVSEETSGIYGAASIIESNTQRLQALLGEA